MFTARFGQTIFAATFLVTCSVLPGQAQHSAPELVLQQAHNAIVAGKNKQAVKMLSKLVDHDKTEKIPLAQALLRRGVAYQRLGMVAASISDFTNAFNLKALPVSEQRDLLFNRSRSYSRAGMGFLAQRDNLMLQGIDSGRGAVVPNDMLPAPTTTASIQRKPKPGQKLKPGVRRHIVVAKPKNDTLFSKISNLLRKK